MNKLRKAAINGYAHTTNRMEWFRMGKIYRVKEEFTMQKKWYGDILGSGGTSHVGDLFELDKEPEHKKKLYRLNKINTKFPFQCDQISHINDNLLKSTTS